MTDHREYSKDGFLIAEGKLDHKNLKFGLWKEYNKQGIVIVESHYYRSKINGLYVSYYDKGSILCKGWYKDGMKDGEFKIFNEAGKLILTQTYFKNKLFSEYKEPDFMR